MLRSAFTKSLLNILENTHGFPPKSDFILNELFSYNPLHLTNIVDLESFTKFNL